MATWLQHIRLSFGGPLGGGMEEWSNTVRLKHNANRAGNVGSVGVTGSQLDGGLERLEAPLKAWFSRSESGIHNSAQLTWAKLNLILTTGKQSEAATHYREWTAVGGGLLGGAPPWYQTAALTMRTDYKRGRAHSGRIFPPLIAYPIAAGGPYISEAQATAMATSWATALDDICAAIVDASWPLPNQDLYPVIASAGTAVGPDPGGPVLLPVTGVVVDRVHDVQHRRTNRVPRLESPRQPVVGSNAP